MRAALYIHVPFCLRKCSYCDFYSVKFDAGLAERFLTAAKLELKCYADHPTFSNAIFETIYIGGGTPSLLTSIQLDSLVHQVQRLFHLRQPFEFTIEINPETVTPKSLREFRSLGVNRLSIGVQSFRDAELQRLGRIHDVQQARSCITWAQQAGFDNISLDLMFAIPGQTLANWQANLNQALAYSPQHLSLYGLTLEPGTALQAEIASGKLARVDEEIERAMYLASHDMLAQCGLQQYEISNFARPGFESQHNQHYWNGTPYLGIGPGAHSFWNQHRQWNHRSLTNYLHALKSGQRPVAEQEQLSINQQMLEFLYLRLRTVAGLDYRKFEQQFQTTFAEKFDHVIRQLVQSQQSEWLLFSEGNLRLTPQGFLLFDEIIRRLAEAI
ncbi:MAG: radical SAM family heme chaperone HemW [candidate division KSB1 bacterium]|nr:radical SAM family heme chaperone HemW [candidate division KSB1 bacterium]